jgi:hypothetical protein
MHRLAALSQVVLSSFGRGGLLSRLVVLYVCLLVAMQGWTSLRYVATVADGPAESALLWGDGDGAVDEISVDEAQSLEEDLEDDYHVAYCRPRPSHLSASFHLAWTGHWRGHDAPLELRPPIVV